VRGRERERGFWFLKNSFCFQVLIDDVLVVFVVVVVIGFCVVFLVILVLETNHFWTPIINRVLIRRIKSGFSLSRYIFSIW
jgi:uncharacterized integral membrane protein